MSVTSQRGTQGEPGRTAGRPLKLETSPFNFSFSRSICSSSFVRLWSAEMSAHPFLSDRASSLA